jgi:hypothetical protein
MHVTGPFFCAENIIMANTYMNMSQMRVFPQPEGTEEDDKVLFQQDSAPIQFSHEVQNALYIRFPNQWTGRGGPTLWSP